MDFSKNNLIQFQLKSDLSRFGLNPTEWSIERLHAASYLISNKLDKGFALYGKLEFKKSKPSWKTLELFSV